MGFFDKPFKATKAFVNNPGKVISNDFNNAFNVAKNPTPAVAACQSACFDQTVGVPNLNVTDKKYVPKEIGTMYNYSSCNKQCMKK